MNAQQFRAAWADIFHVGMGSTTEVNNMVSSLVAGRYNAVIVQVVGYMDQPGGIGSHGAQYKSAILPWSSRVTASFDPLAYLCTQAHANGIEVHAWLGGSGGAMYRVSTAWPPAGNGTLAAHPEWMMVPQGNSEGGSVVAINGNYMLDMGGADAQEYIVSIVRELVTNYPIDGINWDDEHDGTVYALGLGFPAVSQASYAKSGLARYRINTGFVGTPSATDATYGNYRRRFKNELIARCQAEIQSIKTNPRQPLRHTSATMAFGAPPGTCTFTSEEAYTYYSDWPTMLQNGWLDAAIPMIYKIQTNNAAQLTSWCDRSYSCWRYNRHIYAGLGAYLNIKSNTVVQLQYAYTGQAGGNGLNGGVTYSYGVPYDASHDDAGDWWSYVAANLYTNTATVPTMPWRNPATATNGIMWGRVQDANTSVYVDDATVAVAGGPTVKTDGNGYYVATLISATTNGTVHSTTASKSGMTSQTIANATVLAGDIVRYDFMLNLTAPSISGQPQSVAVKQGSNATFTVTATGSAPLYYQWRFNATNLPGAIASSYTRNNAQTNDAGLYSVVVSNATGTAVTSSNATLTVNVPPGITAPPQSLTVNAGNDATFSVTASGTSPFSYQWRFNGANISGATNSSYTRAAAQPGDAGGYSVLVTNAAGSITSAVATLTVNVPPTISSPPQSQTVPAGSNATFSVTASGTAPLSYQWLFNGGNISGANGSNYTRAAVQTNDAGGYSVLITNVAGSITSAVAVLAVTNPIPPPNITQQPVSLGAVPGGSAQFNVTASGLNLAYQWQLNQTDISGATNASLLNTNVQPADFGDYRAMVSNGGGAATSAVAQLTLAVSPAITAAALNSGTFQFSFNTELGPVYAVDYKQNLDDPSWTELIETNGTGGTVAITDDAATNVAGFYRLRLR